MNEPQPITSRDNPLLRQLRQLAQDNTAYRKEGLVWLEGDHLCRALLARGHRPEVAVFTEPAWHAASDALKQAAARVVLLPPALMAGISGLESPAGMGFVWRLPAGQGVMSGVGTVVLDRLQDAGNVGSILRSAAAFGFAQVLALRGTAALWSPKVVRAGMGSHFALRLVEGLEAADLDELAVPLLVTTKGRAWVRRSWPVPAAGCASRSRVAKSRSMWRPLPRSACTPAPPPGRAEARRTARKPLRGGL